MHKRFATLLVIVLLLALLITGCSREEDAPNELGTKTFTLEELSGAASDAIAHIETPFSQGSGFLISDDGLLVTNFHVMIGADSATVSIDSATYEDVAVVASNLEYDIAILKISGDDLTWLPLASGTDSVTLGEKVVAMGNPQGLRGTVSDGIISTVERKLDGINYNLIQTTASVSAGSSGGPLLNMRGEVIGINSLTIVDGQNLNFAVPVDLLHKVMREQEASRPLSEVFGSQSLARYTHEADQLAVVLTWEGDADIDLEIWSEEYDYLGDASVLGNCWDMIHGDQGEEYFVFTIYPETDLTRDFDLPTVFDSGRYVISPYYYSGHGNDVAVTIEIHYPDGSTEEFPGNVPYQPPYDQWFALLVDVDAGTVKILDFFFDANCIALLEWETNANLDLLVWDYHYEDYFHPAQFDGHDIIDGARGLEVFSFSQYTSYDFSHGLMDVDVLMHNPGEPEIDATLTLLQNKQSGIEVERFTHTFTIDPQGDYVWQVLETLNPETGQYSIPEEERLYDEE